MFLRGDMEIVHWQHLGYDAARSLSTDRRLGRAKGRQAGEVREKITYAGPKWAIWFRVIPPTDFACEGQVLSVVWQ
jgi:hypothetical protein